MSTCRRSFAFLAFWLTLSITSSAGPLKPGDRFPSLAHAGDAAKSRVVLVDFWASWCGPCKASFPAMEAMQKEYGERGFSIIAISVDEDAESMRQFLDEHPVSFKVLHDTDQRLVNQVEIEAMPTSFLLDQQGRVAAIFRGFKGEETESEIKAKLEELLTESEKP